MGFGEWLQAERERQGFTLEQVEEETKIRRFYIDALEKDKFSVLPPKVYATGFVKKYAKFLGLEEQPLVEEFQRLAYIDEPSEEIEEPVIARSYNPEIRYKPKNIIAGIAFLALVIWLGSYLVPILISHSSKPEPEASPQKTQGTKTPVKTGGTTNTPVAQAKTNKLIIETEQPCWLLVKVDGQNQLEATIPAGEKLVYEGKKIYIKAGNAGGIKITLNGQAIPALGRSGEIKEKEFTVTE